MSYTVFGQSPEPLALIMRELGHGTAAIVRTPDRGTWLFDAGSRDRPDVARQALGPALAGWECGPVSVVLSHQDRDHDAALAWLCQP